MSKTDIIIKKNHLYVLMHPILHTQINTAK